MDPPADVVKKGSLRFKVSKIKGSSGTSLQGPKSFKELWFMFSALESGEKALFHYPSEARYKESKAGYKGKILLADAVTVQCHDPEKKQQLMVAMRDGGVAFFEAASAEEALEWSTCLNAVLFGKGPSGESVLRYEVDLLECRQFSYHGPCLLEVQDGNLRVLAGGGGREVAKWRLAHIRSFKAKKHTLTVFTGSRSSTGPGEFFFISSQSVQITHAIETIVQQLKSGLKPKVSTGPQPPSTRPPPPPSKPPPSKPPSSKPPPSKPPSSKPPSSQPPARMGAERRPLPPIPPPSNGAAALPGPGPAAVPPHLELSHHSTAGSASMADFVPRHQVPDYEGLDGPAPEYGRLEHEGVDGPAPEYGRLEHESVDGPVPEYGRLEHEGVDGPAPEYGRLEHRPAVAVPLEYGRLERGPTVVMPRPLGEGYGRLQHGTGAGRPEPGRPEPHRAAGQAPGRQAEYEDLDSVWTGGSGQLESPAPPHTTREGYSKKSPNLSRRKPPPSRPAPYAGKGLSPEPPSKDMYEAIDEKMAVVPSKDIYEAIDEKKAVVVEGSSGYNRLARGGASVREARSPGCGAEEGCLQRSSSHPELSSLDHYGHLDHFARGQSPGTTPPENYGRLGENQEEYSELEFAIDGAPPSEGYGRLDFTRPDSFDPYASLSEHDGPVKARRGPQASPGPGPEGPDYSWVDSERQPPPADLYELGGAASAAPPPVPPRRAPGQKGEPDPARVTSPRPVPKPRLRQPSRH